MIDDAAHSAVVGDTLLLVRRAPRVLESACRAPGLEYCARFAALPL